MLCTINIVLQFYPNSEFSQGVDTSSNRPPKYASKRTQTSPPPQTFTNADIDKVAIHNAEIPWSEYSKPGARFAATQGTVYTLTEATDTNATLEKVSTSTQKEFIHIDISIGRAVHLGLLRPLVH